MDLDLGLIYNNYAVGFKYYYFENTKTAIFIEFKPINIINYYYLCCYQKSNWIPLEKR